MVGQNRVTLLQILMRVFELIIDQEKEKITGNFKYSGNRVIYDKARCTCMQSISVLQYIIPVFVYLTIFMQPFYLVHGCVACHIISRSN